MTHKKVRVAIIGVGNCASSLVQGVQSYKNAKKDDIIPGIMHTQLADYHVKDIEFTLGIDVNVQRSARIFPRPSSQNPTTPINLQISPISMFRWYVA